MRRRANALIIAATAPCVPGRLRLSNADVRRNLVSVQLLVRLAAELGLPQAVCLEGSGIAAESLADPETVITASQELQVVRNLVRERGHLPGLGIDAGLRYHLSAYGIWGFALLSSPTYRSAAEMATRFLDLSYAFVRFRFESRGEDFLIVIDDREIPPDVRQFLLERDFAAWYNALNEMSPSGLPLRGAQFRFRRPAYAERFRQLCGLEPRFDAAHNVLTFRVADVDRPLPQGSAVMARSLQDECQRLLDKRRVRTGIAGQVRDRLLAGIGEFPSLETVATELHMAPRSLRRRLDEEGTSFRALTDEIRQALAEELLTTASMKLEEVAARLGYSEPAAFIHAFKRWTGLSPASYRRSQRGNGAPS